MFMQPLKADQRWTPYVLSHLIERWSKSRAAGLPPLPALIKLAPELGISAVSAAAFGSVFELAEACLGRRLSVERCCSASLQSGERALIRMLRAEPAAGDVAAFDNAPPELLDALTLAATSASRLLAPQEHELERLWHTVHVARLFQ